MNTNGKGQIKQAVYSLVLKTGEIGCDFGENRFLFLLTITSGCQTLTVAISVRIDFTRFDYQWLSKSNYVSARN